MEKITLFFLNVIFKFISLFDFLFVGKTKHRNDVSIVDMMIKKNCLKNDNLQDCIKYPPLPQSPINPKM